MTRSSSMVVATALLAPMLISSITNAATVITHAKALAGRVTPADTPGYPITLSTTRSYVLGSNLVVPLNKIGIDVTDGDVTIDLAGYEIRGDGNGLTAIRAKQSGLTVKNGSIKSFKAHGIQTVNGDHLIVENMRIIGAAGHAIATQNYAQIRTSTLASNGVGIGCGHFCQIENNIVSSSSTFGISLLSGNVRENTIQDNGLFGINSQIAGASDNVLINNNNGSPTQVSAGVVLYGPNFCSPNPACKVQ